MAETETIERLKAFRKLLQRWNTEIPSAKARADLRAEINQGKKWVQRQVVEAGCLKLVTIQPPRALGGLIMRDLNPFDMLFDAPYHGDFTGLVTDMIDETIGAFQSGAVSKTSQAPRIEVGVRENFAFVAMPMPRGDARFDDVLDAIKEGAARCGVHAERIDEPASTERITDRVLESLRRAEFVIADLTDARPNVYYEAGYAAGLGKTPIYIARVGTSLEFDLKDYPVIFFDSLRQLKADLEQRLRGIAENRKGTK